jgi:hypothetical protein
MGGNFRRDAASHFCEQGRKKELQMFSQKRKHPHQLSTVTLLATVVAIALVTSGGPVEALDSGVCRIEVLVDGKPLAEYAARGTTYIEALHGREYALRLTNLIDRRIAVALAVDGLNSIDAKTTLASKASKWVLGPHQSTTISGWQVSSTDARRFFFTTEEKSYGTWLGQDANLGVIEAVVYREKKPRLTLGQWLGSRSEAAPAPAGRARPSAEAEKKSGEPADADDLAATGIGRRVDHRVQRVHLDLEDRPASELRLRYEYRQQLVHLGVLPSPEEEAALARRERANGFSDFSFAPDPFSHGR